MTSSRFIRFLFLLSQLMIFAGVTTFDSKADTLVVRYNQASIFSDDPEQKYYAQLLKLALDETIDDYGPYQLQAVKIDMLQQRSISMLKDQDNIDVIWTVTSIEREQQLQAVYVPLLKGLMGNRVFLIKKGEQKHFDHVQGLGDLKRLRAGQGINWPDTTILKYNELNVQQALGTSLYKMLDKKRFDYFPRSITEVIKEQGEYPQLMIENSLMLQYFSPIYFFVNKTKRSLAQRIEVGLIRAIDNGKFDQTFYASRDVNALMAQLKLNDRKIIKLDHPYISVKSQLLQKNTKFWQFHSF